MKSKRKLLTPILFVAPCVIMLAVFVYLPLIQNFIFSLFKFSALSPEKEFIGLQNFQTMLEDKVIRTAILNNIRYAIISIIIQVGGGLVLAAILEDVAFRKLSPVFRTTFFLPVLISMTVICLLFSFIYNPHIGLLNQFLEALHLDGLTRQWLGSSKTAIYCVIALSQWQSTGYIAMLFIVAIQGIPEDLYEAAEIDGANKIQKFLHVTFPNVKQMFFVTMVTTTIGAFTVFNEPYILTKGGGPGTSSMTLAVHMYQSGFVRDRMGYAAAIAVLIFVICAILSSLQIICLGGDNTETKKRRRKAVKVRG